jgi:phage baseplate assembly protein W
MNKANTRFTDIDFLLTKNDLTNDVNVKYDGNAISQSIKNIILTTQKEKLFSQSFGGNAYDLVFNSPSPLDLASKRAFFVAALKNNEPRVNVQSINIVDSGEGRWLVTVSYRTAYNQTNPLTADQIVTIAV